MKFCFPPARLLKAAVLIMASFASTAPAFATPASLAGVVAAKRDLWGEAAMAEPNGASYEFFAPLLPPPRYVHADFRHYPLVLSAPGAKTKARLISNGSGVNLRGGSRSWKEVGTPVGFRVGPDEFRFGDLRERVSDPKPAEGWLPIYEITHRHPAPVQAEGLVPINQKPAVRVPEIYRLEAFASTDAALAEHAVVFVKFDLAAGTNGLVSVELDPPAGGKFSAGKILDERGNVVAWLDKSWKWERRGARAKLRPGAAATLAIVTKPLAMPEEFKFTATTYAMQRAATVKTWKEILVRGMNVEVPEPVVHNAWRNLLAQNFALLNGDKMFYSAGNQYEQLYEAEGSDAALTMMDWGYEADARRMFVPLLDFTRKGLEGHQAGLKLNDILRCYWQTRDMAWLMENRARWEKELRRILDTRTNASGLLPKERYCGDISTPVFSLSVQAKAWRMLHDLPPVLRALGDDALAKETEMAAKEFRVKLDDALAKSIRREVTPPFIPIALLADENIHSPITATRIGSYWNLINGYVIGARLFPAGSDEDAWLPHYLEQHGGLCMGMIRSGGTAHGFWTGPDRVNPLYGTRYTLDTLRRDESERALVSFYGMLAQGFTRGTFIAGEGCTLAPMDDGGRFFYCPPNSAGNAHFLAMLRHLLVQDFDLDGDGEPETLRLLFGTSRRWLEDGKKITVERAPTAFGPVSVRVESRLQRGEVLAQVELPARHEPRKTLLRLRVPDGWRVTTAETGGRKLDVDASGAMDLTGLKGGVSLRCAVEKQ
ncbi:MAG: hypothetical protein HZA89_03570 [Verrucomicrobia bacterium]|nr:hypothetical protein [Verrucomicrobiota bacterium]